MERVTPYRTYWIAWGILLMLTIFMLLMEATRFSRVATITILLAAMLTKATLIGGWFMHLRFERRALVVSVVAGTFATAAVLFFLLIPDGTATLRMTPH
ncbi:MAG: cytochrome C oxidase subunit IV family protein [Gemmatimonadales bacterium]